MKEMSGQFLRKILHKDAYRFEWCAIHFDFQQTKALITKIDQMLRYQSVIGEFSGNVSSREQILIERPVGQY